MRLSEAAIDETLAQQSSVTSTLGRRQNWIGWAPLVLLPVTILVLRAKLLPWVFMWLLAAAIFAGCKWLTWWQALEAGQVSGNWKPNVAYLLLWPGMDTQEFFDAAAEKRRIPASEWIRALAKTVAGIALIWRRTSHQAR